MFIRLFDTFIAKIQMVSFIAPIERIPIFSSGEGKAGNRRFSEAKIAG
jgi:hypothetical protein